MYVRSTTLQVSISAGLYRIDAVGRHCMCTAFKGASNDLCDAWVAVTRCISTTFVDLAVLTAYSACRHIPFDKKPGVWPIGIWKTMHRFISKTKYTRNQSQHSTRADPSNQTSQINTCYRSHEHQKRQNFEQQSSRSWTLSLFLWCCPVQEEQDPVQQCSSRG